MQGNPPEADEEESVSCADHRMVQPPLMVTDRMGRATLLVDNESRTLICK